MKESPLKMPRELAASLRGNAAARKTFSALSLACRREYIQWIAQAKQAETRARRAARAVERILQKQRVR